MTCLACARSFHDECFDFPCCCGKKDNLPVDIPQASFSSNPSSTGSSNKGGRPKKDDTEITTSAGRKRAAVDYAINPKEPCEWRGLANCGGGKHPIIGCIIGFQKHRHHGPIKNTARNERRNVHLICATCHNRWHAANDPDYDEIENEKFPHNPMPLQELNKLNADR